MVAACYSKLLAIPSGCELPKFMPTDWESSAQLLGLPASCEIPAADFEHFLETSGQRAAAEHEDAVAEHEDAAQRSGRP